MVNRFRLYRQNLGTPNAVVWLLVLGYLAWNMFQFTSPLARGVMLTAFAACLIAPLAIMPICERFPARSAMAARYVQYGLIAIIALGFFNVYQLSGIWFFVFLLLLFFTFGWSFWFYSSPRVFTTRRAASIQNMHLAEEEAALEREIAMNQQELEQDQGSFAADQRDRM